jgi:hypothetical protein
MQRRGWAPFSVLAEPRTNQRPPDLADWPSRWQANRPRGASIRALIWQAFPLRADGTSMRDHDVSGIGWQTVNRAIESITTMTPVRQYGHSRNDRPVNAAKRSR